MMASAGEGVLLSSISKRFGEIVANDRVDLTLRRGEIHALLGENGAGKSTLMNILSGVYLPDSGDIFIDGQKTKFRSPWDAVRRGIGMVHQHFQLVNAFSVVSPWRSSFMKLPNRAFNTGLSPFIKKCVSSHDSA